MDKSNSVKGYIMSITNKIKEMRKAKGMTLQQVAEKAGTNKSTIWEVESCKFTPGIDLAYRISAALGYKNVLKVFPNPY